MPEVYPRAASAAEQSPLAACLLACIVIAALAGLLSSFDTAAISGTTNALPKEYALDQTWLGVIVSSALWGTLVSVLSAGLPGGWYGSRDTLHVPGTLYVVAGLGCALAWDWGSLIASRALAGIAVGGSSVLAPVYLSEIAPPGRRGARLRHVRRDVVGSVRRSAGLSPETRGVELEEMQARLGVAMT